MKSLLTAYRVMATVVGVLLVVLCLVGLPLHWAHLVDPAWFPVGSDGERLGDAISQYLGVAHGWLYMIFVFVDLRAVAPSRLGHRLHAGDDHQRHGARCCRSGPSAGPPAP